MFQLWSSFPGLLHSRACVLFSLSIQQPWPQDGSRVFGTTCKCPTGFSKDIPSESIRHLPGSRWNRPKSQLPGNMLLLVEISKSPQGSAKPECQCVLCQEGQLGSWGSVLAHHQH